MTPSADEFGIQVLWNEEHPLIYERLVGLLNVFGELTPDPLGRRIAIEDYAAKLLEHAEIAYALHEDSIVGLIVLYANDKVTDTAHIPLQSVLPEYRRRGIGSTLMLRAIAKARQRGMRRLWLTVERDNRAAQRFFNALGFRITAEKVPRFVMEMDLAAGLDRLTSQVTPIESASRLAAAFGLEVDLRIKRDDLYPLPGGGTKARKIGYIVKQAIEEGYDALVTTGGPQSNHARATAIVAASLGLKCHLVIVLEPGARYSLSGNLLLMKMSGASIEYCAKDRLAAHMAQAVSALATKGHRPLYIWGGGVCLQGTVAFVEAAAEARRQCGAWIPDYLILASGTGSTQAGLAVGYADLPTQVVGISVAREADRGARVVQGSIDEYLEAHGWHAGPIRVNFRDDWTDGGYERYSDELLFVIDQAAKTGLFFDPTYSGKALRGLVSMVRHGEIQGGSRVLLWHTGGLMNLQAAFEDMQRTSGQ